VAGAPAQGLEDEGVEGAVEAVFGLAGHVVTPRWLGMATSCRRDT
jgi:hypothetical protein